MSDPSVGLIGDDQIRRRIADPSMTPLLAALDMVEPPTVPDPGGRGPPIAPCSVGPARTLAAAFATWDSFRALPLSAEFAIDDAKGAFACASRSALPLRFNARRLAPEDLIGELRAVELEWACSTISALQASGPHRSTVHRISTIFIPATPPIERLAIAAPHRHAYP